MLLMGGAGLIAVTAIASGYLLLQDPFHHTRNDLVTHKVQYDKLLLTIVERGALESANNADVFCRVKAGAKNSTVATTIKWVIDDGSVVKKGDLIVDLDDSGLLEQLKTQKITLDTANGNKVQAEEAYKITVGQNESNIKAAEVDLDLAKIDLRKYQEGDFPQALKDVEGRISSAESDLEMQRDRAAWAQRMVKKGYYTVSQAQAEQSKLESYEFSLRKVVEEKRVLTDPEYGLRKRTETDYASKVALKQRELDRIKAQAVATEVQSRTDRETKKSLYLEALSQYHEIESEIKKCKIYAPQDGMVVYFVPEQARFGGGSQQSIVAQGEPVREGQKLLQIPDLKHMLVNTKVHEALVSRVHVNQPAIVRVDSFPDRVMHGKVDSVATISSQQDWLSADVKVYATKVAIGDYIEGLKPGMSAEVTITIGDMLEHVLTVPIQAIVGSAELGKQRRVFVITPEGPSERAVLIGMSNEKMVEIRDGLQEGDEVVLNPKVLVGDKLKTRQPGSLKKEEEHSEPAAAGEKGRRRGPGPGGEMPGPGNGPGNGSPEEKKAGPDGNRRNGAPGSGEGGGMSQQDRQQRMKELADRLRPLSPEKRKEQLEQIPAEYRDRVKQSLKGVGIDVPD
jgi:multidrug efflux pump subunit AcrA (membrane-fusion protein)